jgi:putative tricarboxylic transport membrane protein
MKLRLLLVSLVLVGLLPLHQAQAAVKAATVARVGDQCLREGKVAPGRAIDGSDLVCMKATLGSSKGELLWWYSKLTPIKMFEIISPIVSRNSDSTEVVASRSADRLGKAFGSALKSEELIRDFSSKNFTGGSGTLALSTFQTYRNRLATSFMVSSSLINGLITSKSTLKLSDSKAIARLIQEYQAIAVPSNSKYTTLEQLLTDLRTDPKSVTFIGGSLGSVEHVFMYKFLNAIQVDYKLANYSPQNSGHDVVVKTLTDRKNVALSSSGNFVAQVATGKLRILGIASPEKLKWSKAKTLQQQGVGLIYSNWFGVMVPPLFTESDTSNFIRLLDVLQKSKGWAKTLDENYWSPGYLGQNEFLALIEQQLLESQEILSQLGF